MIRLTELHNPPHKPSAFQPVPAGAPDQGILIQHVAKVPAAEIEVAVIEQLRVLLRSPEIVVATFRQARQTVEGLTEEEVRQALEEFDALWAELFPAEQARIVQLLVERIDVDVEGLEIRLRVEGLGGLYQELAVPAEIRRAA